MAFQSAAYYKVLRLFHVLILLPFNYTPGKYDIFEIEDCEVVVLEFVGGMVRYNVCFGPRTRIAETEII